MRTSFLYTFGWLVLAGALTSQASAQMFMQPRSIYNPYAYNPYVNPYVANAQALATQQYYNANATQSFVQGNYYGNPYYQQSMYPSYNTMPYGNAYNPSNYSNPYGSAYGSAYGTNPVSPGIDPSGMASSAYGGSPGYGSNPYDPYGYGSYGQTLKGAASLTRSFGELAVSYEQARVVREQYNQSRLETRKKQFELEMYIKANTPSYTEEQARIARLTLKRIRTNSTPGEITNGKSMNLLLDDLNKIASKKTMLEPVQISEGVLSQLNITKNNFGLGILRDDGKFIWPAALQEVLPPPLRKELDGRIHTLVREAYKGQAKLDVNALADVRSEMDKIKTELIKRVNDVPTAQYLDAKRFLQEFYEASVALERGEAQVQSKFQRFAEGGKTLQDVIEFMNSNGFRFAPATAGDEAAYRSLHSALAAYDIAINAQVGQIAKE